MKQETQFGLNPFEVREVLQERRGTINSTLLCLNPFEVREVLQERVGVFACYVASQSL